MLNISSNEVFRKLLDFGLFPEAISDIFTTVSFGAWSRANGISSYKEKHFSNITFHLTRNNNAPRILNIPHPIAYFRLCKEIKENWSEISTTVGQVADYTERSMIIPKPNNLNDRLVSMLFYGQSKDEKFLILDKSFKAKYLVNVDIANCYPSIYSHSIPWALVGKKESKENATNKNKWYNKLDFAIRSVQRNETVGIPIGPDTSRIISEIVLSQIDKNLIEFKYFRYIDDFKCYCKSKEEVDTFIKRLSKELEKYHLRLNQKKTKIIELPKSLQEDWVRELKNVANTFLEKETLTNNDINYVSQFIDLAIKLNDDNPDDSSIKYAVKILSKKIYEGDDIYAFVILYLSRICFIYPYFIDVFFKIFELNKLDGAHKVLASDEINSILMEHKGYSRSDVALWGLHIAMNFDLKINDFEGYSDYLINDRDCLPVLLCYEYAKKTSQNLKKYFSLIEKLKEEKLEEEWWIYLYTLYFDSPRKQVFKSILFKDFYEKLSKENISFIKIIDKPETVIDLDF